MNEKGISLLEFLICQAITAALLVILSSALLYLINASIYARKELQAAAAAAVTAEKLNQIIRDIDGHPLPLVPRIHSGVLTTFDGTPVRISGAEELQPDTASTAVTYASFDFRRIQRVKERRVEQSLVHLSVCPRYTHTPSAFDSFLVISPNGMVELLAPGDKRSALSGECEQLSLRIPEQSMLAGQRPELSNFALALLPIRSIYTIYLDSDGNLRYAGHLGGAVIENQPIYSGLRRFNVAQQLDHQLGLLELSVGITLEHQKEKQLNFVNHLGRQTVDNVLLNGG
ncbi:MAG: hypothetical protein J5J00_07560 [Deltaproteobacteria bacterium]|nr:hypothetical protein [Deltaproteobacteria bacterium]